MADHKHKTDTAAGTWDDWEYENDPDDGEDGEWAGGERTDEEFDELAEAVASADMRWLEYARYLAASDPRALELSPHAEYLQGLLDKHGVGNPPDDLEPRVLH